ncbi:MAG: hypothetical protein J1E80_02560 [Desulfovibrionaceae bacterium]|nr:hypothetical protein [Desulfovibrionaceae bacterium]
MSKPTLSDALLEALRYEHWLRFYFVDAPEGADDADDPLAASLRVPASAAEASRRAEPHLFPLLEALRGRDISMEGARDAVFRHVALRVGADPADPAFGERLFHLVSDPDFRRGLDAFHGWVQELANGEAPAGKAEDEGAPPFALWQAAFRAWEAERAVRHVTSIGAYADKAVDAADPQDAADA